MAFILRAAYIRDSLDPLNLPAYVRGCDKPGVRQRFAGMDSRILSRFPFHLLGFVHSLKTLRGVCSFFNREEQTMMRLRRKGIKTKLRTASRVCFCPELCCFYKGMSYLTFTCNYRQDMNQNTWFLLKFLPITAKICIFGYNLPIKALLSEICPCTHWP